MQRSRIYERCPLEVCRRTVVQWTSISPTARQTGVRKGYRSCRCNFKELGSYYMYKGRSCFRRNDTDKQVRTSGIRDRTCTHCRQAIAWSHGFYLHMTNKVDNLRRRTFPFTRSGRCGYPLSSFSFCNSLFVVGGWSRHVKLATVTARACERGAWKRYLVRRWRAEDWMVCHGDMIFGSERGWEKVGERFCNRKGGVIFPIKLSQQACFA